MAKYTSADIQKIAERLKGARDRDRAAHFLLGAGCSITAGIPSGAKLVEQIHAEYPTHCAGLKDEDRHSYGACMALLSRNERRDLIKPHLDNAKINWGTIAIAQLIAKNFVSRILTVNFDLVLENACGLLGLQPAVYDFGVAPVEDVTKIVSPSIIHLHGQSYGLVRLNTDEETSKHRAKLQPILKESLRTPLVVVGYSGSADDIFKTLLKEFQSDDPIYWASHEEEPKTHIRPFLEREHFHFVGGTDFDRFMIELAQSLNCWPPNLFANPLGHLLDQLSPVVAYPVTDSDSAIDLLRDLRSKLESWQSKLGKEEKQAVSLRELFMKAQFEEAMGQFRLRADSASNEDREIASWSSIMLGNALLDQAKRARGDEAARLFAAAGEKYLAALAIKPDRHEALYNGGILLFEQGKRAEGDEAARLFAAAGEKYRQALAIKSDYHNALNNWGSLLLEQARRASGDEAARLFAAAGEKYQQALAIKPDYHDALNNWGSLLLEQAKRASGDEATRLFAAAGEKYRQALAIKPDYHDAPNNWGSLLFEQAKRASGDEAARLFAAAGEKYRQALAIKPDYHDAPNNWGSLLFEQAKRASGDEAAQLFAAAGEKYQQALTIKPDYHDALNNWGSLLFEQAKRASGGEAARLFAAAGEKYQAALAIKPDSDDTLTSWGNLLLEQAKRASGDEATRLFAAAVEKYQEALAIKPDRDDTLTSWGSLLFEQSKRASGGEAERLFAAGGEKYRAALAIKPDSHDALYNWGGLLVVQSTRARGNEAARLLADADQKLIAAAKIDPTKTYNLSCIAALRGDEKLCRENLLNAERYGTLPNFEYLLADTDFDLVRDKPWFQEMLGRQKPTIAK
jgi:Tfp pilus assembly protein PilF